MSFKPLADQLTAGFDIVRKFSTIKLTEGQIGAHQNLRNFFDDRVAEVGHLQSSFH
jgi:hypothetical protein